MNKPSITATLATLLATLLLLVGAPQLPLAQRRGGQHRGQTSHARDDSGGTWGHFAVPAPWDCP